MAELDLSTLPTEDQIAALYIGYYDRAGEPDGSTFWENTLEADNAFGLASIASNFAVQQETLDAHPFFTDPTAGEANAFITDLYINLFNRQVDEDGLAFWSDILTGVIDGESFDSNGDGTDDISEVGDIILAIIEGAQDVEGGDQDKTTILNKIEVATAWTDAAEAAGATGAWDDLDADVQTSAKSIIEDVDEKETTVTAAKATINTDFAPEPVPGNDIFLTSGTDVVGQPAGNTDEATNDNDTFWGYSAQNPMAGGMSNTLSSADRLDGKGGDDRLYAELSFEFFGTNGFGLTDIQPRLTSIEEIDFEARDFGLDFSDDFGDSDFAGTEGNPFLPITVDAKNITDHEEIGSYYSDGDLKIENLTTLTEGGSARNTSDITVTMDHTDNFNSDNDASDLVVLFDNDYLLSGQTEQGFADFFILDQDAELALKNGDPAEGRLDDLDKNGIQFRIDTDGDGDVDDDDDLIEVAFDDTLIVNDDINTHEEFRDSLQAPLQDLIADGTLPEGTTIELFEYATVVEDDQGRNANQAVLDDGSRSDLIPAVRVELGNDGQVEPVGFSTPDTEVPPFNFFGRIKSEFEETDEPISIDIDLEKAGRGGEGGNLIVGGKADTVNEGIAGGIKVFNIDVKGVGGDGADAKPSNVGTITSTLGALEVVNIATHEDFVEGDSHASLVVRNGFDQDVNSDIESGDLKQINANSFLGNLTLGDIGATQDNGRITNADTIMATGGGDVTLGLRYDGNEEGETYSVTTGEGDDTVNAILDGDATDYAGSSLNVSTGGGDDVINLFLGLEDDVADGDVDTSSSQQLNQAILDNVDVDGGSGDDHINVDGLGNANIEGGSGNDVIMTDGDAADLIIPGEGTDALDTTIPANNAIWAFNFDATRALEAGGNIGDFAEDELPGEQLSLAYIGGATVTVTLSGAGVDGNAAAGGGVMSDDTDDATGAINGEDGYESEVTISSLLNGNDHFGTQADINAAVIEAINEDAVLGELLAASMGPNNTLVVESLTSGDFDATDLRIDIAQLDQRADGGDADEWNDVEDEAQALFQDSSITIDTLADANTPTGNYGAADLSTSADADSWYDGLSVDGDDNSTAAAVAGDEASNLHTRGTPSASETDNVIDGGADDDLIVLSTDAVGEAPIPFTVSSNNALFSLASNETIKLTGDTFGDDTIMNFQDGEYTAFADSFNQPETAVFDTAGFADGDVITVENLDTTVTFTWGAGNDGGLADFVTALDDAGTTYDASETGGVVTVEETTPAGVNLTDVTVSIAEAVNVTDGAVGPDGSAGTADDVPETAEFDTAGFADGDVITVENLDTTVTFTWGAGNDGVLADFVTDLEDAGTTYSATESGGVVTLEETTPAGADITPDVTVTVEEAVTVTDGEAVDAVSLDNGGLDFLDYGAYLTSTTDVSGGTTSVGDSEQLIDVTLDNNTGNASPTDDVEANEVVTMRYTDDPTETGDFDGLSGADIAALFNNSDGSGDFDGGALSDGSFDVSDGQSNTAVVNGNAKGILMVENAGNLGEYKVFELSWDASEADGDEGVSANLLGSMDFGDSLDDLAEVNLVGSSDHSFLLENGFGVDLP